MLQQNFRSKTYVIYPDLYLGLKLNSILACHFHKLIQVTFKLEFKLVPVLVTKLSCYESKRFKLLPRYNATYKSQVKSLLG